MVGFWSWLQGLEVQNLVFGQLLLLFLHGQFQCLLLDSASSCWLTSSAFCPRMIRCFDLSYYYSIRCRRLSFQVYGTYICPSPSSLSLVVNSLLNYVAVNGWKLECWEIVAALALQSQVTLRNSFIYTICYKKTWQLPPFFY